MKKLYMSPTMIVTFIHIEKMIAASDIKGTSGADGLGMGGNSEGTVTEGNTKGNNSGWGLEWDD